jgi:hypothetical protein
MSNVNFKDNIIHKYTFSTIFGSICFVLFNFQMLLLFVSSWLSTLKHI